MGKKNLVVALVKVVMLCVVIFAVSAFFVYKDGYIGYILVALGLFCLWSLKLFHASTASLGPDILFGVIDNGIAGVFEGYYAELLTADKRTVLGSAVGKMAGCLFGAGAVLIVQGFF